MKLHLHNGGFARCLRVSYVSLYVKLIVIVSELFTQGKLAKLQMTKLIS